MHASTPLKPGMIVALTAALGLSAAGCRMTVAASSSAPEQSPVKAQPRLDLFGDSLPDEAIARMGSGRLRQPGTVLYRHPLFFSPDGKQLLSSADESWRIWDAATGKLWHRFDFGVGHKQTFCRYVGDGVICVDMDDARITTVQIIDAATGKVSRRLRLKERGGAVSQTLSPDGKRVAVPRRGEILLCDTTTGEMVQRIPLKGVVAWSSAFAPDGKSIAINDLSDAIYLYNTATGKLIREFKRPGENRPYLVFSPDGRFLASMPQNPNQNKGPVSIWNVRDGKEIQHWTHSFPMVWTAAFSPDGKRVAVGGGRWGLILRDVETGEEVRRLSPQGGVSNVAFSPDGKTLATASPRGAIRLWDAATGKLLPASADPGAAMVGNLFFSSDGKRLWGGGSPCLIWDAATGLELKRFIDPKPLDFKQPADMHPFVLSPDESLLVSARPNENITLSDAATGKEKQTFKIDDPMWNLLFTPDSRRLISSGAKAVVHVWDAASGRELHQMPGRIPLAVSPDGRRLAAADAGMTNVLVYDLTTGQETKRFAFPQSGAGAGSAFLTRLAFAPDGNALAAVGGLRSTRAAQQGIIRLWDLAGSGRVYSFDGRIKTITSVAFSPDGRSLATGENGGELILWEVNSGRPRHSFAGHESQILSLAFSPDGRALAASSADAPVYAWDVAGSLQSQSHRLSNDELQRGWNALAAADASAAFQAIRRLAAAPEQALPFLREHLKPVPAPDEKRLRQLLEMLDGKDFQVRQKAAEELENQGDAAAEILRKIVAKEKPSLEVRRRLQEIVQNIESKPESLRALRAVEGLEWIATPDAVRLLGELAAGADARLTREAAAAKSRLRR